MKSSTPFRLIWSSFVKVRPWGALKSKFGTTINKKGYEVLNYVRVIQGDGCSPYTIERILTTMEELKWSATNVAFGMGGALLQKVNRDTQKFAFKCSSITVKVRENEYGERDVFKQPVTDTGKQSKPGRLDYLKNGTTVKLEVDQDTHPDSAMVTVFEDGQLLVESTFDEVRNRAKV